MTENQEKQIEEDVQEFVDHAQAIHEAVEQGSLVKVLGHMALTLFRLTQAQEKLVIISEVDLQQQVEAEIQARAETMANEIVEERSKRAFIGKR